MVLLTAMRTLRLSRPEAPAPRPVDEHIEDMIDIEHGLRPAREIIVASARKILRGYDALRFPGAAGQSPGSDED